MAYIIIADDDDIVGEVACEALIKRGHVAGVLSNGLDALRVINARKPDLVILDCNMPDMSGLLVLRELRKSIEFYTLPVLMLTARLSANDVEIAFHEGATDYMKKPFDRDELVFRVDELLAKSHHPRRAARRVRAGAARSFGS